MRRRIGGDIRFVPGKDPARGRQQPGHQPQQARFAGAVAARQQHCLAGGQLEGQARQHLAFAATADDSLAGKSRFRSASLDTACDHRPRPETTVRPDKGPLPRP
jgi:hypothetical protein